MADTKDYKWLAGYVYYSEPLDKVITGAVIPFVYEIMEYDWVEKFFFIRYWEKGPHIRLRFLGDPEKLESVVKPRFQEFFGKYFSENPSERQEPDFSEDTKEEFRWYPNNSVQFIEYEPETERYGGEKCLEISEKFFQYSSETIFELMSDGESEWGYDRALGAGIQMHLSMAFGLGMDRDEMIGFFDRYFSRWLPRAYYFFEKDISEEELAKRRKETLEAFEGTYENQKDNLVGFFEQILEILNEDDFEGTWLETWVNGSMETKEKLDQLIEKGAYDPTSHYNFSEEKQYTREQQSRWALYDSYVHMTNNRLGILNRDEAYLAFIISKTLKLIK
ncbi:MAG: lantibiotic dehydratase C-terminal domain-containing protein [Cyclobacteriaceae bacterium]